MERFLQQYQLDENDLELEDNDQEELVSESSEEFHLDDLSEEEELTGEPMREVNFYFPADNIPLLRMTPQVWART